jgi:hypothetical protein
MSCTTLTSVRRRAAGQTIYQAMLVMTCVALLLALIFPVIEFIGLYAGPGPREYDPEVPAIAPAAPAPAAEAPAPADTGGRAPGGGAGQ